MRPAICIEPLGDAGSMAERVKLCAEHGFDAVEIWGWRDKNPDDLGHALSADGVALVNMSAHRRGSPIDAREQEVFLTEITETLPVARALGCRTLMVLSNELGDGGRVIDPTAGATPEDKHAAFITALRAAMPLIPPEMNVVLEPLNTEIDHPGNFLSSLDQAREIIDLVGDDRLGILADLYHMAVMGADPSEAAREFAPWIRHVHIASLPHRAEPDAPGSDDTDWRGALRTLAAAGYDGAVGFEFWPAESSAAALTRIRRLWDSL
jgi:hydroxypyruvate isomerase